MTTRHETVIGIDVGTSGGRAEAMDATGRIVGQAATRLADITSDLRDPQGWRSTFERTRDQLLATVDPAAVGRLCVDGTSGTVLAVDACGHPLAAPLMYNDPVWDAGILALISWLAPCASAAHGVTSGEVAWQMMANDRSLLPDGMARCLLVSRDNDLSPLTGLPLESCCDGNLADIVWIAGSEGDHFDLDHYRS